MQQAAQVHADITHALYRHLDTIQTLRAHRMFQAGLYGAEYAQCRHRRRIAITAVFFQKATHAAGSGEDFAHIQRIGADVLAGYVTFTQRIDGFTHGV